MSRMSRSARRFARDNRGATTIEYGLMLALILVMAVLGFRLISNAMGMPTTTPSRLLKYRSMQPA